MTTVRRLYPGATIACLGSGPSLTRDDCDYARAHCGAVIAVNDAWKLCPAADVLYAHDAKWWHWQQGAPAFGGLKYAGQPMNRAGYHVAYPDVQVLTMGAQTGLSLDPGVLCHGKTSGYQALNLAVLLGAARILLLGYDMHGTMPQSHFFGEHPDQTRPPYAIALPLFATLVEPLAQAGVEVINCTPGSALTCFPMRPLREALQERAA